MKKAILVAIALAGLIVPSALIAQAVVVPNSPIPDWWEIYKHRHGAPPAGFIRPSQTPVPHVESTPAVRPLPTPVPHVEKVPPLWSFPTPVPHVGNPPLNRPSLVPTNGPGVLVYPSAPVLVQPNPALYGPLAIFPFVAPSWDFYGVIGLEPYSDFSYSDPIVQNGTLESSWPTADNWELGISGTPIPNPNTNTIDALVGFHLAYSWSALYFSWDSIAVPNYMVQAWTGGYVDSSGNYVVGYNVPGFLNLLDAGLRVILRPLVGIAEVGINNLYVYNQGILAGGVGANFRLGAGLKFGFWGVSFIETSVYGSWNDLTSTIGGLFSSDTRAASWNSVVQSLVPSIQLTFYF